MEGAYLVMLRAATPTGTDSWGDSTAARMEYVRYAKRFDMATGSEQLLADASLEVGGALTWEIRKDDELDAARPTAGWTLTDIETGDEFEVFSVTDRRITSGARFWRLHSKRSAIS